MRLLLVSTIAVVAASAVHAEHLLQDVSKISRYWGQISPYVDNDESYFGVEYVGIPDGCQIEQAHSLQRHANRFQTGGDDDGGNDQRFAAKLSKFTSSPSAAPFTGPLSFLNTYTYILKDTGLLTGLGASTEFLAGVQFWNRYGRTLYNATVAQLAYNASLPDGTSRPKPVLRTTSQSRIQNSQINWALGFFGPSFQSTPNPTLAGANSPFDVVIITEGETENNTLASYDSCLNSDDDVIGYLGDLDLWTYIPRYLANATARLQMNAPSGFTLTVNDTYAMQSICAYETTYIGSSDFCGFFTREEWDGFENTLDMEYYYDYSYGNPTGRAQGIGWVQELISRLTSTPILTSNSSVNSTLDSSPATFPLPPTQLLFADFTHDDIIISVLTALSIDYFRDPPTLTSFPPDPKRKFILSHLTPFGGRLVVEVLGCKSADPEQVRGSRTFYTPRQYGYNPNDAENKFVRFRVNHGIVPLASIRGGGCAGREDGLCALDKFLASQANAYNLSNYDYACFGNYTIADPTSGKDYDGTIFEGSS